MKIDELKIDRALAKMDANPCTKVQVFFECLYEPPEGVRTRDFDQLALIRFNLDELKIDRALAKMKRSLMHVSASNWKLIEL